MDGAGVRGELDCGVSSVELEDGEELDEPAGRAGWASAPAGTSGSVRASGRAASCNSDNAAARPWARSVHRIAMNWARPSSIQGWLERIQAWVREWASDGARVAGSAARNGRTSSESASKGWPG